VLPTSDLNKLLGEQVRSLNEVHTGLKKMFPEDGGLCTYLDVRLLSSAGNALNICKNYYDAVQFIESMLRQQLGVLLIDLFGHRLLFLNHILDLGGSWNSFGLFLILQVPGMAEFFFLSLCSSAFFLKLHSPFSSAPAPNTSLVSAIGSEVTPTDFAKYMVYHNRKIFARNYQPKPFSYAIGRPGHTPEGKFRFRSFRCERKIFLII
jgi:hypothetical protein